MKHKWLPYAQWTFIACCSVMLIISGLTDSGVQQAIDGVSLGFVVMSMLVQKIIGRLIAVIDGQQTMIRAMVRDFERAIADGKIDVHMIGPGDDHPTNITVH